MTKISVLMPVHNAGIYLPEAIESILNQTFSDFELLIFNDGSTDNSAEVINSYKDDRIKFLNYPENHGYVKHLNHGIDIAQGEYIARMDADDISDPCRFEKQVKLLDANQEIGICGSWYDIIGDSSDVITIATQDDDLRIGLLMNSVFGHPSVMMRTATLRNSRLYYDESFMPAEDYHLWVALSRVTKLANIGEVLLHYRRHDAQISSSKRDVQLKNIQRVRELQVEYLLQRNLTGEERRFDAFLFGVPESGYESGFFNKALAWANELIIRNTALRIYDTEKLFAAITKQVKVRNQVPAYRRSLVFGPSLLKNGSNKFLLSGESASTMLKFYIKCLIRRQAQRKLVVN